MDWIVKSAAPRHRDWALAMRAEYRSLSKGRAIWVLGCLSTAVGWWLRAEALYIVAVIAGPVAADILFMPFLFDYPHLFDERSMASALEFYLWSDIPLMAAAAALAFWRDGRVLISAILIELTQLAYWYLYVFPVQLNVFGKYISIHNQPPFVGEGALFAVCLLGALFGYGLRKGMSRLRPRPEA